jgi:hypothetical protein
MKPLACQLLAFPLSSRWRCIALCTTMLASLAPAKDIFVSPNGSDSQAGTRRAPVKTLFAAKRLARRMIRQQPVTITVLDGEYYLDQPLVLFPEDSGTPSAPVLYRAEHEGKAVLSGGTRLKLNWEPYRDGIFMAKTPPGLELDQLFLNGKRQIMARYPNYDPQKTDIPYRGSASDAIAPERVAKWADPGGGYIHAMHPSMWGGFDYLITGKGADGALQYVGGWQNNRPAGMHKKFRMVENIFEELDAPGEWFHNRKTNTLYFYPPAHTDLKASLFEGARLASIIELRGTEKQPIRNVTFSGFTVRHVSRTFMLNREPLLRSDWTIYRGGAIYFEGTEDCKLLNTFIDQPGGNGVFVNNYNRRLEIAGMHIFDCGASAVAFVGDPKAVRNPAFSYDAAHSIADVDRTPGPLNDNYPMECTLEDSLIHEVGTVEKQGAGVEISMSRRITIRHCSIYDTSRAGINIGDGTWGGHVIDECDVFRTVQETGDHGSFNSWGRDRYWVPDTKTTAAEVAKDPGLPFLDAVEPNTIRNSRWRCDHGWDIDLDDGSTNYIIKNNLLLNGGLKLREGYRRVVQNNVIINNSLHPHVWFPNSGDKFVGNIVMTAYHPAVMPLTGKWGEELDHNLFASSERDRLAFAANGADEHSVVGDPMFLDPSRGDFTVENSALAKQIGFVNFPMDHFGVRKTSLRKIAEGPVIPHLNIRTESNAASSPTLSNVEWMGARLHDAQGSEMSAYGMPLNTKAVAVLEVISGSSPASLGGLRKGDLIIGTTSGRIESIKDLLKVASESSGFIALQVIRNQSEKTLNITLLNQK